MCWLHANNVATLGTQRPQTQRIQLDETRRIVLQGDETRLSVKNGRVQT